MDLQTTVKRLNEFAPLNLAESWDNVGLLVEPHTPRHIQTILITNDLTENVMEEACVYRADMILSYHPPLFRPIKSIRQSSWKASFIIRIGGLQA